MVVCHGKPAQTELMASVYFFGMTDGKDRQDGEVIYTRYSDRYMETRFSTLITNAPHTSAGNR